MKIRKPDLLQEVSRLVAITAGNGSFADKDGAAWLQSIQWAPPPPGGFFEYRAEDHSCGRVNPWVFVRILAPSDRAAL